MLLKIPSASCKILVPFTALKVRVGSPLIELVRVVYDRNGRGVEHLHALYRPDRYNLEMELVRSGKGDAGTWAPVVGANSRSHRRSNGKINAENT